MKKAWKVPFTLDGNEQLTYTYSDTDPKVRWVDPYEFVDTLEFVEIHKGRSAVNFRFKSVNDGREYTAGTGGFIDMCRLGKVENTETAFKVTCKFGFAKRGANYLLTAVGRP